MKLLVLIHGCIVLYGSSGGPRSIIKVMIMKKIICFVSTFVCLSVLWLKTVNRPYYLAFFDADLVVQFFLISDLTTVSRMSGQIHTVHMVRSGGATPQAS